jgi:sialate O-acetylesterase
MQKTQPFKTVYSILLIMLLAVFPIESFEKSLLDFESFEGQKISGVTSAQLPGMLGLHCAKWDHIKKNTRVQFKEVPADWTNFNHIKFNLYAEHKTFQEIHFALASENPEEDGPDYFRTSLVIDWQGWKTIHLPFSQFSEIRFPKGWGQISEIKIVSDWTKKELVDNTLYFDDISLVKRLNLSSLFSHNMIFQADKKVTIWGEGNPGQEVSISLSCDKPTKMVAKKVTVDRSGQFRCTLPAQKSGGNWSLDFKTENDLFHFKNVTFGDVWLCSGESNMDMAVYKTLNAKREISSAQHPDIRLFKVDRNIQLTPQENLNGQWETTAPETVKNFSAVAYYFARELQKDVQRPIGLIHSAFGGTQIKAWMSLKTLEADPLFDDIIKTAKQEHDDFANIQLKSKKWGILRKENTKQKKPTSDLPKRPTKPHCSASVVFNGMIHPLLNLKLNGCLWYQGESDSRNPIVYASLLPAMIQQWRTDFQQPSLPFFNVQLANYKAKSKTPADHSWARIRDAQASIASLPEADYITAIDLGLENDFHPLNKQEVGRRLALLARARVYQQKTLYSGPRIADTKIEDNEIHLSFEHVGSGLELREGQSFAIAGQDKVFHWADAQVKNNVVILTQEQVKNPIAVRYAWAMNPDSVLYNKEGLPAPPFRTDTWAFSK